MLGLWLPLFEAVLKGVLQSEEFKAWLKAAHGPGAVETLEMFKDHAAFEIARRGY